MHLLDYYFVLDGFRSHQQLGIGTNILKDYILKSPNTFWSTVSDRSIHMRDFPYVNASVKCILPIRLDSYNDHLSHLNTTVVQLQQFDWYHQLWSILIFQDTHHFESLVQILVPSFYCWELSRIIAKSFHPSHNFSWCQTFSYDVFNFRQIPF